LKREDELWIDRLTQIDSNNRKQESQHATEQPACSIGGWENRKPSQHIDPATFLLRSVGLVATRWIRILFRVWKDRTAYDQAVYLTTIKQENPAIIPFLPPKKVEA